MESLQTTADVKYETDTQPSFFSIYHHWQEESLIPESWKHFIDLKLPY